MSAFSTANLRFDSTSFTRLPISFQRIWIGLLVGAATVASAAFACAAPFAAVAMLAAATLPLRQALAVSAALWIGNQIVGYGLIDYPVDGESIAWGIIVGSASLAAVFVTHRALSIAAKLSTLARLVSLFAVAFATYQLGLLLGSAFISAHGGMAADIVAYVAFINATWTIGLGAAYVGLQMLATATAVTGLRRGA